MLSLSILHEPSITSALETCTIISFRGLFLAAADTAPLNSSVPM